MTRPSSDTSPGAAPDTVQRCRLCHGNALEPMMDLGSLPIAHRLLSSADEDEEVFPMSLSVCRDCGLTQIDNPIDPEVLYRSYNYNFSSWKAEPHLESELDSIFAYGPFRSAFEIGCNEGLFLDELRNRGIDACVGVEPNPVSGELARERGFQVFGSMISPEVCTAAIEINGRFDLVVSRQVIEHVLDLDSFFACIDMLLDEDGLLFLDMPDFGPSLQVADCSVLWEEHVSYFSEPVIKRLLDQKGFETMELHRYNFGGGSMAVLARRRSGPTAGRASESGDDGALDLARSLGARSDRYRQRLTEALSGARGQGAQVVLYGVGLRGCMVANGLSLGEYIDFAIDDQPEKHGKYMPGARLEIRPVLSLNDGEGPVVVLLAVANENEEKVAAALKDRLTRPLTIVSLCGPRDFWQDLDNLKALQ